MQFDYARLDLLSLEIWSRKFDQACFDYLSCETYAKLSTVREQKVFWPSIIVIRTL